MKLPSLLLLGCWGLFSACGSSSSAPSTTTDSASSKPEQAAVALFAAKCVSCHGTDGQAQIGGAANLAKSTLDKIAITDVISNGRKAMRPYKGELSPAQLEELANYVLTLKK